MSTKSTKNSKNSQPLNHLLRARFGERFKDNEPVNQYVSARVGGVAEYIVVAESVEDLTDAGELAATHKIEYQVIGSGTGTLPSEVGFPGLLIINRTNGLAFSQNSSVVVAASGLSNQALLTAAASKNLGGIEFLSGVPGTIGGAVVTNATYQHSSIGAFVRDITCWVSDSTEHKIITIPVSELRLEPFRSLLLQPSLFPPIILTVRLQLASLPQEEILRRLQHHRLRSAEVNSMTAKLGTFLRPPLETEPTLYQEARKLKVPGLRFQPNMGVITATSPRVTADDYRALIAQLQQLAAGYGVILEDRVTYLGYWPPMENEYDHA